MQTTLVDGQSGAKMIELRDSNNGTCINLPIETEAPNNFLHVRFYDALASRKTLSAQPVKLTIKNWSCGGRETFVFIPNSTVYKAADQFVGYFRQCDFISEKAGAHEQKVCLYHCDCAKHFCDYVFLFVGAVAPAKDRSILCGVDFE